MWAGSGTGTVTSVRKRCSCRAASGSCRFCSACSTIARGSPVSKNEIAALSQQLKDAAAPHATVDVFVLKDTLRRAARVIDGFSAVQDGDLTIAD
jgi:hypothetical protein